MDVDSPLVPTVVEASWAPVPRHGTLSGELAYELWLRRIVLRFGDNHGFGCPPPELTIFNRNFNPDPGADLG